MIVSPFLLLREKIPGTNVVYSNNDTAEGKYWTKDLLISPGLADHYGIEALNDELWDVFQDSEDYCDKRLDNGDLLSEQLLSLVLHLFVILGDLTPYLFLILLVFLILLHVVLRKDELHLLLVFSFTVF